MVAATRQSLTYFKFRTPREPLNTQGKVTLMANKSHFNSGHIALNKLKKDGGMHSSTIFGIATPRTVHGVFIQDAVDFLKTLPDSSVQLILAICKKRLTSDHEVVKGEMPVVCKKWLTGVILNVPFCAEQG